MPSRLLNSPSLNKNSSATVDEYPSFWSLVHDGMGSIVSHAVEGSKGHIAYSKELMGSFSRRVSELLDTAFKTVPYHPDQGSSQELHKTIHKDVEDAVDGAMKELHIEEKANSTFRDNLVKTLDTNLEMSSFNRILANSTGTDILGDTAQQGTGQSFQEMPVKDETVFVTLVCMAVIVPVIFISIFVLFLYKRQRDSKERRDAMLLKDQPEFSMDEYPNGRKSDEEPPDLELKNLRV